MKSERYQLVAIDNVTKEKYVIELTNDNKFNKGSLDFIDNGTCRFKDKLQLAKYFYDKGKIPTLKVNFTITYINNKEEKHLPVIFNDEYIYNVSKTNHNENFIYYVVRLLLSKLSYGEFYDYLMEENNYNRDLKKSGSYLNNIILGTIANYYSNYVIHKNIGVNITNIEYTLFKELKQYKQLRTLYYFMKNYDLKKRVNLRKEESLTFGDFCNSDGEQNPKIKPSMQEEVDFLRTIYGMDEVYSYYDGDQVFESGCLDYKK